MLGIFLAMMAISAEAKEGRYLPSGEENPAMVEKVFTSPRGEVHFLQISGGHSALLRNIRGGIANLKEVNGSVACDEWFISSKAESIPSGCEFLFHDEEMGGILSVRSDELEESSLFQAVRGSIRGAIVAL
jgi:hypothetical protein